MLAGAATGAGAGTGAMTPAATGECTAGKGGWACIGRIGEVIGCNVRGADCAGVSGSLASN